MDKRRRRLGARVGRPLKTMVSFERIARIGLLALLVVCAFLPFLFNFDLDAQTKFSGYLSQKDDRPSTGNNSTGAGIVLRGLGENGVAPVPLPRTCSPGVCLPRRYFSTTNQQKPRYYLELNQDPTGRNGIFSTIPSRPWDELSITSLNLYAQNAADLVRKTMEWRCSQLIESDMSADSLLPKYLPPQFPQWDRAIHQHISSPDSTLLGIPPQCCPSNAYHRFVTKNFSEANVLSEEELNDCECRSPRNYPKDMGRPIATIVTAFYEMSSKHPAKSYEKLSRQLLSTADPMIIFCEPKSRWCEFFAEERKHAPTLIVPLKADDLRLKQHFSHEKFWKTQYIIDPEGTTHHKGVNTMLYVIWGEKLILLHSAAMLNPFNTTQFAWVDTGYWRNPAPHLYRQSAVRINITAEGVKDESTLLFQMIQYNFNRDAVISGNQVLVGGNSFIGTYNGVSNLYSAFYETFWIMSTTGQFVGSDQKVLYRTCHTYPSACHIHKPRKMKQWLKMLGELLPGVADGEKIGKPLELADFTMPEKNVPIPPNGIVHNATSDLVWKGVERVSEASKVA
ncbi:hypothetical protein ACHAWF_011900 [Thalassiosira exigua]